MMKEGAHLPSIFYHRFLEEHHEASDWPAVVAEAQGGLAAGELDEAGGAGVFGTAGVVEALGIGQ